MITRAYINSETLKYLRESRGVDIDYVCRSGMYTADQYIKWESQDLSDLPTLRQAKEIAKQLQVPFAALYMDRSFIPQIPDIPHYVDKRSYCEGSTINENALRLAIIELANMRELLLEAQNEFGTPIAEFDVCRPYGKSVVQMASLIREEFEIDINEQYQTTSKRQLFLYLKRKIEERGVFVQGFAGIPVEVVRGVALFYSTLPIVGINDKDRYPARSFTLVHELTHVINRSSSVCDDMFDHFSVSEEEVYCNAVAGEVLVPRGELVRYIEANGNPNCISLDFVSSVADKFSVSREVIIRRLLDIRSISATQYNSYASELQEIYESSKEQARLAEQSGSPSRRYMPNVARDTADSISFSLNKAFLMGYGLGEYSAQDITRYLGIKQKHFEAYLQEVAKWSS